MVSITLKFPGRRYHATPWGHHVNEGQIEWPPSPWRILRAFISTGYTSGLWGGAGPTPLARSLIEKLAATLPVYRMPHATGAHTRHYMPLATIEKEREATTLVFDTWAQIGEGDLTVIWEIDLRPDELDLFRSLTLNLGYLGRAESRVDARVMDAPIPIPASPDSWPDDGSRPAGPSWEQVPLLAPMPSADYDDWRTRALAEHQPDPVVAGEGSVTPAKGKKRTARRAAASMTQAAYPPDLIACLQVEVPWLKKNGWNQPPGSRRVLYWRRADALETGTPMAASRKSRAEPVEAMLLSLSSESGNDHVLPSVTRTLPQADLLHRALIAAAERKGGQSAVLTGCDEAGEPLARGHQHAHLLPLDLDNDEHIDHVLIWAPMGLDDAAQEAARAVRRAFTKGGIAPLRLAMAALGSLSDLTHLRGVYGVNMRRLLGAPGGARRWTSLTPFVPPRYLKKGGRNTLEGQVAAELASRGKPGLSKVELLDPRHDELARRHRHYARTRQRGPSPALDCAFTLCITLQSPTSGPVCLGYGSHFGLGLFEAVEE